ncbi:MAG: type II toxin-antitoxin system prevent-host-death family antitoxin [Lachnospiraceae bacterium]|jgi:prevent-host-death family protein
MPNTKPISDLCNYAEVLKEVKTNQPVYLTRNGRRAYAIVDIDELEQLKAKIRLLTKPTKGENYWDD